MLAQPLLEVLELLGREDRKDHAARIAWPKLCGHAELAYTAVAVPFSLQSSCAFVIPAFDAELQLPQVIRELQRAAPGLPIWVVDDGSGDRTGQVARAAGAEVLRHRVNRGKGAALVTGLEAAARAGAAMAVSVDADGQHLAHEALRVAQHPAPAGDFVLGVRDLAWAQAPANSQFSNALSNWFLSVFAGQPLRDTQCGLRRYPLPGALELGARDPGYALEAEILLRAARAGIPIHQLDVEVYYPPPGMRQSHFHVVKDPSRIIRRVVKTLLSARLPPPRAGG